MQLFCREIKKTDKTWEPVNFIIQYSRALAVSIFTVILSFAFELGHGWSPRHPPRCQHSIVQL